MSLIICHNESRYNLYCTVSDGFFFEESISLEQLKYFIGERYGDSGLHELPKRLKRAHKNGHSALNCYGEDNLKDFLCCNRAGYKEANLSYEECIREFLS